MPWRKHRCRCSSCKRIIDTGAIVAKFECFRNSETAMEWKIYADEVPLAPKYLCEECADLYFSLFELGFECIGPGENMRELVAEYAAEYGRK